MTGVAAANLTVVNNNGELRIKDDNNPEQRITYADNDMWVRLNSHVVECIVRDVKPLISLTDGLKAIAVSEAAYRSLKERREIFVEKV